ncbi:YgiT-type zinc finger protein [candidate division KSB1 bacterium]|nr:YgiT-type zinc finger protein [candidate division KSB1 bacterium]
MKSYDYGECEICDTPMQERLIKQDFWIQGQLVIVSQIPAGVCPQCGEKIVRAEIGRKISDLLSDKERIIRAPQISVPELQLDLDEMTA